VREAGGKAVANQADVRDRDALERMADAAMRELGGLHIAVANAGIARGGSVLTMSEDDWDTQIDVNLKGVYLTVQVCARAMVRQNSGGRIITISSLAGERPSASLFAYCASKAGVRMMTRCWAIDLAPFGVTVNAIGPGIIETPLGSPLLGDSADVRQQNERAIPAGRAGQPYDIGALACWLASDEAEYMTGTYNLIDGGLADGGGFGVNANPGMPDPRQALRDARRQMSGEALLAMIDQQTAAGMAEFEACRKERGLL
jgi:NAD(P)-dependent dehydrogenase (short-subunit alcohol dehydrogenase family)